MDPTVFYMEGELGGPYFTGYEFRPYLTMYLLIFYSYCVSTYYVKQGLARTLFYYVFTHV